MRWFAAFWITVVLCVIGAGLAWVGGQDLPGLGRALAPFSFARAAYIPVAVVAAYLLVRLILQRVVAYTESAIDASPRESRSDWSRRRAALGLAAYQAFGNPTGRWLLPFAVVLDAVAILTCLVMLVGLLRSGKRWDLLGLTLLCLYAYTVTMAMLFPDRAIRLRPEPEIAPDPVLDLPEAHEELDLLQAEDEGSPDAAAAAKPKAPKGSKAGGNRPAKPPKPPAPARSPKPPKPPRPPKPPKPPKPPRRPFSWRFWRSSPPRGPVPAPPPPPSDAAAEPGNDAGRPGETGPST